MKLARRHPSPVELSRAACDGMSPALERHLAECATCAASWASLGGVEALARELPTVTPSPRAEETLAAILAATEEHASQQPARRPRWRVVVPTVALAGAAVAAVLPMVAHRSEPAAPAATLAADGPTFHGAVRAQPDARFTRESGAPDEVIRLHDGSIAVDVTDLHRGERFRVVVGDAEIEGHATSFEVSVKADELASLQVVRGRVDVRPARRMPSVIVAGERWEAQPIVGRDVVSEQTHPANVEPTPAAPATRAEQPTAATRSTSPAPPNIVASTAPTTPTRQAVDRPIAKLFDRGWQQLKDGKPAAAVQAFDEALTTNPGDPLTEDISFWRGIALKRLSRTSEARQALESFLDRYSRSPRAGEASVLLGWMQLEEGQLDQAERRFRAAQRDAVEAVRVSAEKGLGAVAAARAARSPGRTVVPPGPDTNDTRSAR